MINNHTLEEDNKCNSQSPNCNASIAIQMDSKTSKISTTISTRRNVRNFYEFKEVLGT